MNVCLFGVGLLLAAGLTDLRTGCAVATRHGGNGARRNAVRPPGVGFAGAAAFGSCRWQTVTDRTAAGLRTLEGQRFGGGFLVWTAVDGVGNLGWVRTDGTARYGSQNAFTTPDLLLAIADATWVNATAVGHWLFRCHRLGSTIAADLGQNAGVTDGAGRNDFGGGLHFATEVFAAAGGHLSLLWVAILVTDRVSHDPEPVIYYR